MPPEIAAPAAPPAAAPAPAPTPPPAAAPSGDTPSAQDAFETQFNLDPPASPATPAPAAPSPAPAPPKPAAAKPAAKPATPPKPGAPAAAPTEFDEEDGVQVPRFKSDKDFRGWGLKGYKEAKQLRQDLQALQGKHDEISAKIPQTETERKQLAEKLAAIEKQHAALQEELKYQDYQRSDEYKTKFETPYRNAISRAHSAVGEFTVTEEDRTQTPDANGAYPTKERQATPADFDEIYSLKLGPATKLAAKKFGPEAAPTIMAHYNKIRELGEAAVAELQTWKTKAEQRAKDAETQRIQSKQQIDSLWEQVNKDIREKNKDLFMERDGNKEWNENLAKGTAMADAYFSDRSAHPVGQRVVFDAQVRNRIAAFPALVGHVRSLEAQLEDANKTIAELRGSGPGTPQVETPEAPAGQSEGAMAEFDKKL